MDFKETKILIIGLGSIGQRHYNNLRSLGFKNVSIFDTDVTKLANKQNAIFQLKRSELGQFRVVFICNPNNEHVKTARMCVEAGCDIFVEKPVSNDQRGLKELICMCERNKIVNMVGCNMRFHPCISFINNFIKNKGLGKVFNIRHEFGYYLPSWRPGQDYRKNYAAKKETGGGIVLDDIHEFDLLFWLNNFEAIDQYKIISSKVSKLEIETEDQAAGIFRFKNKVVGIVSCDYLSQKYHRTIRITGEYGNLQWSYSNNEVIFESKDKVSRIFYDDHFETNQMYLTEAEYFMEKVRSREKTFNNIERAAQTLKVIKNLN
ncbi:MAG: Gfo/Idh/MocA family oxidoreductase [Candidatus Vogelbacteria bacterium]|nr:Gfo/Idh/MocA family oxidoreductase [Candidatus Vogelbacteria bacterium]